MLQTELGWKIAYCIESTVSKRCAWRALVPLLALLWLLPVMRVVTAWEQDAWLLKACFVTRTGWSSPLVKVMAFLISCWDWSCDRPLIQPLLGVSGLQLPGFCCWNPFQAGKMMADIRLAAGLTLGSRSWLCLCSAVGPRAGSSCLA